VTGAVSGFFRHGTVSVDRPARASSLSQLDQGTEVLQYLFAVALDVAAHVVGAGDHTDGVEKGGD
jgi:hypothetical protein